MPSRFALWLSLFSVAALAGCGSLPLIEYLFSNRTENESSTTLFAFIRPLILRDDAFADLKYLSERDRVRADLPDVWPSSDPLLVY